MTVEPRTPAKSDGNCTHLITDLHNLATANFMPELLKKPNTLFGGTLPLTLSMILGIAVARAGELKCALGEVQRLINPADPQVPLLNSILCLLN
jgi:hypothetical protein